MSDDRKETFSLDGGKYEIDRNQAGLMIGARRHGEPWPAGFEQLRHMGVVHAMLDRIEALEAELAVSREAIEVCLDVAERLPSDDDGAAAVRYCTLRRLNEAVGKAVPRLMMERPEGQKLYGLNYMEMRGRIKALGAANEALEAALRIAEAETVEPVAKIGWAANITNRLRELADAVTRGPDAVASEFTMSVPARPERDADLVLSAAADEIERLRATLERQQLSYERERCAQRVVLHSQYPIETDYDRGYDKARKDAAETLRNMSTYVGTYTPDSQPKLAPLTEFERMRIIGDEFPIALVQPAVIAKVDAVCRAIERAHGIGA